MIITLIAMILMGIVSGFGLERLGGVGRWIFWLVILYQAVLAAWVLPGIVLACWRAKKNKTSFEMPYGLLVEYAMMFPYFTSGLIGGYWIRLPWTTEDTAILVGILMLVTGATIGLVQEMISHLRYGGKY